MNNTKKIFTVTEDSNGKRLDVFLATLMPVLSRSYIQQLIKLGNVTNLVGSSILEGKYKIKTNEQFSITNFNTPSDTHTIATEITLNIVYEDDDLIIINKQKGLVVHPGSGNKSNTMVNGLLYKYKDLSDVNGSFRSGIVHRIDKDTSGLLVVAKNNFTHYALARQFSEHTIERRYRALVWGVPKIKENEISTFIKRNDKMRLQMQVSTSKGKLAITTYKVINTYFDLVSLVDLKLKTGRTHQIRVHMDYIGHSVVADPLYKLKHNKYILNLIPDIQNAVQSINGQMLHAYKLGFIHPRTLEYMEFEQTEDENSKKIYDLLNF